MELRFLPTTGSNVNGGDGRGDSGSVGIGVGGGGDHQTNIGSGMHSIINNSNSTPDPHRRTLERSHRNIVEGVVVGVGGTGSRRTRRSSGSGAGGGGGMNVPGSPRIMRGVSSEYIQHNRSPMPVRTSKRGNRLGTRTENMSSGSLNSIEV